MGLVAGQGDRQVEFRGCVRVLIVDDSRAFRHRLALHLGTDDAVDLVGMAKDGKEAIDLLDELQPDVVFMDQNMPALSGVEATAEIKRRYPHVRVFIVTGEENVRQAALLAGADGFFAKDEGPGPLLQTLRNLHGVSGSPHEQDLRPRRSPNQDFFWKGLAALAGVLILGLLLLLPAVMLPLIALTFGLISFLYASKYYLSSVLILLATSNRVGNSNGAKGGNGNGFFRHWNGLGFTNAANGKAVSQPFVSIHLPLYNEKAVVDRLLEACTSLEYENYEVIVADDSTDETTQILRERWESHPRVKISHREKRDGFKGGALQVALQCADPKTEYVVVLDADFIPPPDILHQFLAYFYGVNGKNGNGSQMENSGETGWVNENLAVIQGYQWHILNASENWITRAVRAEFSGSYVVERASQELLGAMKMVSGSVFMIRADLLRELGWRTSITEDWELTLRIYLKGYKVLYTPFIQAPSECVATFGQLTRQRMRWAEGHTRNVKRYFKRVLASTKITLREKLEFLYYAPYYLQAAFFILGTSSWLVSELILKQAIPFWTETLGWALVFTNGMSLVLMNLVGLFLERGVRRNWTGVISFILLTYLLVPYQAYAALKGLLEPREGGWHRTRKTGVITEVIGKLGLRRRMRRFLPGKRRRTVDLGKRLRIPPASFSGEKPHVARRRISWGLISLARQGILPTCGLLILAILGILALNGPGSSKVLTPLFLIALVPCAISFISRRRQIARGLISLLLAVSIALGALSTQVLVVSAAPDTYYLRDTALSGGRSMTRGTAGSVRREILLDQVSVYTWYSSEIYPTGNDDASIAAGAYTFVMDYESEGGASTTLTVQVGLANPDGTGYTQFGESSPFTTRTGGGDLTDTITVCNSCPTQTVTASSPKRLVFRINVTSAVADEGARLMFNASAGDFGDSRLNTPTVTVPENVVGLMAAAVLIPTLAGGIWRRRERRHASWERLGCDPYHT